MLAYIYTLSDPRTNDIRYVGKTNNPGVRLSMHKLEKRNTRKNNWIKSLLAIGLSPVMDIIEELPHDPDSLWQESEVFWINSLRFLGFNLTNEDGGGVSGFRKSEHSKNLIRMKSIGRVMTQETIEKIKASKIANLTPEVRQRLSLAQKGKKQSPETVAKRSAAMKGHCVSNETRIKIGNSNRGKELSAQTKAKISASLTGRSLSLDQRQKQRAAMKGRAPSPQCIAASVASKRNWNPSPETRARMSAAAKARTQSPEGIAHKEKLRLAAMARSGIPRPPEIIAKLHAGRDAYHASNRDKNNLLLTVLNSDS